MLVEEKALSKKKISWQKIGYKYGRSGDILLYAFLYKITRKEVFYEKLVAELEEVLYLFSNDLFEGRRFEEIADFGRVCFSLESLGLLDIEDFGNVIDRINTLLRKDLKVLLAGNSFHYCNGLLAVAYYFIESDPHHFKEEIDAIIQWIDERAQPSNDNSRYWVTPFLSDRPDLAYLNNKIWLGNVHGILSIVRFLLLCKKTGFDHAICERNIREGVNYVLEHYNQQARGLHSFPEYIGVIPSEPPLLQWNYGSFNILFSLATYAAEYVPPNVYNEIIDSLLKIPDSGDYVCDFSSICYGTAGVALVYNKLYRVTNIPAFNVIAEQWRNKTYSSLQTENEEFDDGFLIGRCGTLAAILLLDHRETNLIDNFIYL